MVFLQVGTRDSRLQTLASGMHGADGNLATGDLDNAAWLFKKCSIPASRLEAPGANEDATFHHHSPDAYDAMRLAASPNAKDLSSRMAARISFVKRRFAFIRTSPSLP